MYYYIIQWTGSYWRLIKRNKHDPEDEIWLNTADTIEQLLQMSFNSETGRPFEIIVG